MAEIELSGIRIAYELRGPEDGPPAIVTPGGRFNKESGGVPQLADKLAEGGRRVVLWDRPNCGASDISFDGISESELSARMLVALIRAMDFGPTLVAGGSAGSRVSLIAAAMAPEMVSHLAIWWISGEPISLAQLAAYYCGDSAGAAAKGGMEAVAALPAWAESLERNPRNRDLLLKWDPEAFIARMQQWARAYTYSDASPVPGMAPDDFGKLAMPVLVYRSGKSDLSHTRRTSEWVHEMIPHSEMRDPPWPDTEWNDRSNTRNAGHGELFDGWPLLAPEILAFAK